MNKRNRKKNIQGLKSMINDDTNTKYNKSVHPVILININHKYFMGINSLVLVILSIIIETILYSKIN